MAGNADPVALFMAGVKINKWRKVGHWLPLLLTLPGMLRELITTPDGGLLGYRLLIGPGPRHVMLVQYWRSSDDLLRFARDVPGTHRSAQRRFWRHYGSGGVGVWHELLPVAEGVHHGMHGNMPPIGLGALHPVRSELWWMENAGPSRDLGHSSVEGSETAQEPVAAYCRSGR